MLYHHLRAPHSGVDIEQMVVSIREGIDADKFRLAWEKLVNHYAAFRSGFQWDGLAQPIQVEHTHVTLEWEQQDLSGFVPDERKRSLDAFLRRDRERGFDL